MTELHCTIADQPAALERLLQTVRIRGFHVQNMDVNKQAHILKVRLTVVGARSPDLLMRSLERQHDVESIFYETKQTDSAVAA